LPGDLGPHSHVPERVRIERIAQNHLSGGEQGQQRQKQPKTGSRGSFGDYSHLLAYFGKPRAEALLEMGSLLWRLAVITLPRPMKAQRRHELKSNSLIWTLQGLPEQIKKYQSRIALVMVLVALAIVLVRYRITAAEQRLVDAQAAMGIATDDLARLRNSVYYRGTDLDTVMKTREAAYSDGLEQADAAFQKASDSRPAMKAQALLDKGDFNFEMANFPELPGATTQASLRPAESQDSLLSGAADAYGQVIQNYPDQKFAVVAARFGLAAVNENRGAWDDAKTQYQAILDSDAEQAFKDVAKQRLDLLPQLSQPVTIGLQAATKESVGVEPMPIPALRAVTTQPSTKK
jgi:tetratricopeptide (TPR) repeat protein